MNFRLFSDTHNDQRRRYSKLDYHIPEQPEDQQDVLILAGDIDSSVYDLACYIAELMARFKAVVFVPGNHEFYEGATIAEHKELLINHIRSAARRVLNATGKEVDVANFHYLNNEVVRFGNYKLIGSTLWTQVPVQHELLIKDYTKDFRLIKVDEFVTMDIHAWNKLNEEAIAFIQQELDTAEPEEIKIVITHHSPTFRVLDRTRYDPADPTHYAYHNNLDAMTEQVDYWLFGHIHRNFMLSYEENECVLRCNCVGYANENLSIDKMGYVL